MANTNQAKKRARQAESRRAQNSSQKSALRKEIKKFRSQLSSKTERSELSTVQSHVSRAAQKGLIPKNAARRLISRLNNASKQAANSSK
ncbi:MAG: 30S ribosomal protein S20 [Pseudomonadota bacterium]|nr:30S ribosomal protein S20 [Pseudomonadota bacterium]